MALAYTPGLKIKADTIIRKERKLPIAGEILVDVGDNVSHNTVVGRATLPGESTIVNVAGILGCDPEDVESLLLKKVGDHVNAGEVIASTPGFFGIFKSRCLSPVDGVIHSVSELTGKVVIKGEPIKIEVDAYVSGRVVKKFPNYGALVETRGAIVQGIFGVGGETHGELMVVSNSPEEALTENNIGSNCANKILVGGSNVTSPALREAVRVGVRGIVVGGIETDVLNDFIGYEIGVAVTGHERLGLTLMITEGFGEMNMSSRTFKLLKSFEGHLASMNGATQIRAGVIRPEIVIPRFELDYEPTLDQEIGPTKGMEPGMLVRIIRNPYFGYIGRVIDLPVELQKIATESFVRVAIVELENGCRVTIPRANLEIIEE